MKKKLIAVVLTAAAALSMSMVSFAASWQNDGTRWWYQNDDGTYPANTWQWIDGNGDGTSESYYFDSNGYLLTNTTTPDGYQVNSDGAWVENGATRQKTSQTQDALQIYIDAVSKNSQQNSMEADININMTLLTPGKTIDTSTAMNLKYKDLNTSSMKYLATTKSQMQGQTSEGIIFYTSGYYYINMDGQKIRMPMDLDKMMAEIKETSAITVSDFTYMTNLQMSTDENGNRIISYTVDSNVLLNDIKSIYDRLGIDASQNDMSFRDMSGTAVISPDGYCRGESIKMSLDMKVDGIAASVSMTTDCQYKNPGQPVDFSLPSTDGYTDI